MKLVRCVVRPCYADDVVDALKALGAVCGLTVTGGGGWSERQPTQWGVYRGRRYEVRLTPEVAIDVTVPDHAVDDVVQVVTDTCRIGQSGDDVRILVMAVEDWHEVRARRRRIA